MRATTLLAATALLLGGCTSSGNLNSALGTMKNPDRVLAAPLAATNLGLDPTIASNYALMLCLPRAFEPWRMDTGPLSPPNYGDPDIINQVCADMVDEADRGDPDQRALAVDSYAYAGLDLADEYCELFFEDADESQRRRQYGRAVWNDVGTALSTVLGLANAGENLVTGAAAAVGLGDSVWRNYDEAFVVGPDLSSVYGLVYSEQQLQRTELATNAAIQPRNFAQARRVIRTYARHCTHLGMRSLLNRAAARQEVETEQEIAGVMENAAGDPPVVPVEAGDADAAEADAAEADAVDDTGDEVETDA